MPGMPALEIYPHDAPSGWDDALRTDGGVVFHSTAWASYKVHENGGEPLFCAWLEGGEVIARALAMRRPPRSSRLGRVAAKLVFDSPPTGAAGAEFVPPLLGGIRDDRAVTEIGLGSFDARGPWLPGEMPQRRARCEFVLPPGDADDVWVQMRQLARRKVKRAQKADFSVRPAPGEKDLAAFAEIYAITEARLVANKGYEPGSRFDRARFAAALGDLIANGAGRLYGAFRGEELEAGVVFTTFGERAYMIYSGATDEGRNIGGPFLVMFEALKDLRESDYETINLGGAAGDADDPASSEHGLYQFKTRFGAEVEEMASGTLVTRPLRAKLVAGLRKAVPK